MYKKPLVVTKNVQNIFTQSLNNSLSTIKVG